jgi:guanosine-3',5'-bis(diphosphate) 3'-pyrophosphohydrolase
VTLDGLLEKYNAYASDGGELIKRAYSFAEAAHADEGYLSGVGFMEHLLAVATILVDIRVDKETLAAALLHDILECTDLDKDDLSADFGEEIAELVSGVTAVRRVSLRVGHRKQTSSRVVGIRGTEENITKLVLAIAKDARVLLIRMAEEADNLYHFDSFDEAEKEALLSRAFEVYSPIADILGVSVLKRRLDDLAFRRKNPKAFARVARKIKAIVEGQRELISDLKGELERVLAEGGVTAVVVEGREKSIYSAYQKAPKYEKKGAWYDILGLRIITEETEACYQALDIVRKMGRPDSDLYDDYIANPKPNGYQSLHIVIWINSISSEGDRTIPVEIQIRTKDMHERAEFGLASHAYYKEKGESLITPKEKVRLLRNLVGWEKTKKLKLFANRVFVFTPKADVIDLPRGATPVDFAFAVHTDVGRNCAGAKVDGRMVSLDYQLKNGELVEITTVKGKKPTSDWLKFVKTDHARSQIRKVIKGV